MDVVGNKEVRRCYRFDPVDGYLLQELLLQRSADLHDIEVQQRIFRGLTYSYDRADCIDSECQDLLRQMLQNIRGGNPQSVASFG